MLQKVRALKFCNEGFINLFVPDISQFAVSYLNIVSINNVYGYQIHVYHKHGYVFGWNDREIVISLCILVKWLMMLKKPRNYKKTNFQR